MLLNDLLAMLMELPPMLATQWAAWFAVGLVLSIWGRQEKARLVVHSPARHQSGVRATPVARPLSAVRTPAARAAQGAAVSASAGDAFAELEALLEQPMGSHRMPGESSTENEDGPAPISLP